MATLPVSTIDNRFERLTASPVGYHQLGRSAARTGVRGYHLRRRRVRAVFDVVDPPAVSSVVPHLCNVQVRVLGLGQVESTVLGLERGESRVIGLENVHDGHC